MSKREYCIKALNERLKTKARMILSNCRFRLEEEDKSNFISSYLEEIETDVYFGLDEVFDCPIERLESFESEVVTSGIRDILENVWNDRNNELSPSTEGVINNSTRAIIGLFEDDELS